MTVAAYNDIESGHLGTVNIDADPLFVDAFHLWVLSPCIDAGNSTCVSGSITTELDGNPCFANGLAIPDTGNGECPIVDLGAHDLLASWSWDLDCIGNVGITEFLDLVVNRGTRLCNDHWPLVARFLRKRGDMGLTCRG